MSFHRLSFLKIIIGVMLAGVALFAINVYEDPGIGISLLLFGVLFLSRGSSFFLFLFLQNIFHQFPYNAKRKAKESYKLSLLFGVYILINIILLILEKRTKLTGLLLLGVFAMGQVILFIEPRDES